jgi:cellulose synthase/poly-beta-1,6-N-acetylglucosamine synthase-like glycosyltransferase
MHVIFHVLFSFFAIITILYFIYIVIHLISWRRLPYSAKDENIVPKTKISVIIAARNEEATISNCIQAISVQNYPSNLFELIIVNDHSTDKTKVVVEELLSKLKITGKCISNREKSHGKKTAISEGIKNSSGELIVITDADSRSNNTWLSTIESVYQKTGAYMICGPVQIMGESGLLGYFQSLELCGLSMLSGAGINAGFPLLCNGANLAYTRKVFDDVEGFKRIDKNPSGDDILLMFKIHEKYPGKIHYVKSRYAIVSTFAQTTVRNFILQRIRWGSKGLYSKNVANIFVSMLVFCSNFLSVLALLYIIVRVKLFPLLVYSLLVKIIADFLLLLFATNFFNKKKVLWIFPVAEIFTMVYISWVGIAANFSSYNWKDRHYKRPG